VHARNVYQIAALEQCPGIDLARLNYGDNKDWRGSEVCRVTTRWPDFLTRWRCFLGLEEEQVRTPSTGALDHLPNVAHVQQGAEVPAPVPLPCLPTAWIPQLTLCDRPE